MPDAVPLATLPLFCCHCRRVPSHVRQSLRLRLTLRLTGGCSWRTGRQAGRRALCPPTP